MKDLIEAICTGLGVSLMLIFAIALQMIPWMLSIYCGIWLLDYFFNTGIL